MSSGVRGFLGSIAGLAASVALNAAASTPDMFGLGAANAGLAGGVTARADDPYAAYYNPAGLTQGRGVQVAFDLLAGQANLRPFSGIVFDTDGDGRITTADGAPDHGVIGADYRVRPDGGASMFQTSGVQFGASAAFGRFLAAGIAGFLPQAGLAQVEVEDPALPYYVMFRSRNQRLDVRPALSIQPLHDVRLGVGAEIMTAVESSVRVVVSADVDAFSRASPEGEADVRAALSTQVEQLSARMKYKAAPTAGLLLNLGAFVDEDSPHYAELQRFGLGVAYRGAWAAPTQTDVVVVPSGQVRFNDETVLLEALAQNPIQLRLDDPTAFFEPAQLALGLKAGWRRLDVSGDVTYSRWSSFEELVIPNRVISFRGVTGVDGTIEIGRATPDPDFHDTLAVRAGASWSFGPWSIGDWVESLAVQVRGGFAYIPSPVGDQTGLTNFMDSDRRVLSAGLGLEVGRVPGLIEGPVSVHAAFQHHALATRRLVKDAALAADADGDGLNDYPYGYPLEGSITSAGSAWALTLGLQVALGGS